MTSEFVRLSSERMPAKAAPRPDRTDTGVIADPSSLLSLGATPATRRTRDGIPVASAASWGSKTADTLAMGAARASRVPGATTNGP